MGNYHVWDDVAHILSGFNNGFAYRIYGKHWQSNVISIADDTAETTSFVGNCLPDVVVFELTVTDSIPKSKSDTVTITLD